MTFPPPNDANRPGNGGGFGPPPQQDPQQQPQPPQQQPQGFGPPPPPPPSGPAAQPALPPGGGFGAFGPPQSGGPLPGGFPPSPPPPPSRGGGRVTAIVVASVVAIAVVVGAIALGSQGDDDGDRAAADETPSASASRSATATPSAPSASPSGPSGSEDPGQGAPFDDVPKGDPDSGTSPEASESAEPGARVPYVALKPGTCFDHPAMDSSVSKIEKRSCSGGHDGEVIANETLTGDFSSEKAIQQKALALCAVDAKKRLRKIPNDGRNYYYYALYPALGTYSVQGEDTVSCALTLSSGLDGTKLHKPLPK
ncbi:hypothetical protein [Streptomyces sp. NPDC048636]|uniref:hypothetical protein n=1 Tax=Streptomyces sp. NPDC048636 TaxID=3155762 RepID=UPI00342D5592